MPSKQVALTREEQLAAFEEAVEQVRQDRRDGVVEADVAERGRSAGTVPDGEVIRVLSDAYTGSLDVGSE